MKKISISVLKTVSKDRPIGYYEEVVNSGRIEGDILILDDAIYYILRKKFSHDAAPSLRQKTSNFIRAGGRIVMAMSKRHVVRVSGDEQNRRLSICQGCEFFTGKTCLKCGCIVNLKIRLETEKCPIGKW